MFGIIWKTQHVSERDSERSPKSFVHFGSCVAAWGVLDEEFSQTPDSSSDPVKMENKCFHVIKISRVHTGYNQQQWILYINPISLFPSTKYNRVFQLAFGLLQKISFVTNKTLWFLHIFLKKKAKNVGYTVHELHQCCMTSTSASLSFRHLVQS